MFKNLLSHLLCVSLLLAVTLLGCATSPTGRSQFIMHSEPEMSQMGAAAFAELKSSTPRSSNTAQTALVECVANAIVAALTPQDTVNIGAQQWEVELFDDPTANAFALPGGKMGVHTGLLKVAKTPDQLAAVMGHEVGHVIARHGNERMSQSTLAEVGMNAAAILVGADTPAKQQLMGALGLGVQYGVLMPFGRTQESEADTIGIELMARAGFNPQESVWLWENMAAAAAGPAPPEFMSTHPSNETRIAGLQASMPKATQLYEQARASGRRPNCR